MTWYIKLTALKFFIITKTDNQTYLQSQKINNVCLVLAVILTFFISGCIQSQAVPRVENGYLDLSNWDFNQNGPVRLDGDWEFYWEKLLEPKDFQNIVIPPKKDYIKIPGLWKENYINEKPLPPKGYATYRIIIKGLPKANLNALLINDVLSVCNVWTNGQLLTYSGQVGTDKISERPQKHSLIARFSNLDDYVEIVFQVSNFHNMQGGVNTHIWLGPDQQIQQMTHQALITTAVLGGALLIMGLFHMALYGMHRKEIANLYFGLYCAMWASQTLFGVNGGCLMATLFPSLPWRLSIDMTLFPYGFTTPLLVMFYHALFPNKHAKLINRVYKILGGLFVVYLLFTPPNAFDIVVSYFVLVSLSAVLYLFYMFILDLIKNRKNILFLIPGYLVLALTGGNDVLYDRHIINTAVLVPYGTFFFILSYSFLISVRSSLAFSAVENLTMELQLKNIELSKLNLLKDEFIANTSHELKTPLNGIMGLAQSLVDSASNTKVKTSLSLIISSSIRLLSLINDLLDSSRLKNRELELDLKPLDIKNIAESVIMVSNPLIRSKPLIIENKIPKHFGLILSDEDRLSQILFNLIGNAIKFTDKGNITLMASKQGEMAKIEIKDTGIGIPENKLEQIFQAFDRVDQGASRNYGGTGLGLAIAKELVQLHGGNIGVSSKMGIGSIFWFTIPFYSGSSELEFIFKTEPSERISTIFSATDEFFTPLIIENKQSQDNRQNGLIMVVDDDPVNLQVLINHLESGHFKAQPFAGGCQALDCLEKGPLPDLILLDIMMPEISGYDVCRKIREKYSASELPVILLTAKNRLQDLVEGFTVGSNDYLTKPFFKDELMARIKTQLQLKQAFKTVKENLKLKKELGIREKRELELKLMQRRLSGMLNRMDDAVLAVNPVHQVGFCNHAFEILTNHSAKDLLGCSVLSLFEDSSDNSFKALIGCLGHNELCNGESYFQAITIQCPENKLLQVDISLSFLDLEEDALLFLILKKTIPGQNQILSMASSAGLINDLNRNNERLGRFEASLNSLTLNRDDPQGNRESLKNIDTLLDQLSENKKDEDITRVKRSLAVKVMNAACDLWIVSTKTSKIELADRSGLWTVYIEKDGWARTQTLDKYLNSSTLPARPRWKTIINTADFVLAVCEKPFPLRKVLEEALIRLRKFI